MRNPFVYGIGGVLSADIAVPDHERELKFYSTVLTTGNAPLWRDDLMNNRGAPIIGLGARTPEYEMLPLQWMPHFQVADIAASVKSAIERGGRELIHSQTDEGQSQWAVLADPNGAAFGLIPVVTSESDTVEQNERQGKISWLSLTVPDIATSSEFYHHVVGWNAKPVEANNLATTVELQIDPKTIAGEIRQAGEEHEEIPPVWIIHLPVDDLDESLRLVGKSGGTIIHPVADECIAIVRDPAGVHFALQAS